MPMSAEIKDATEETAAVDAQKRAFLKKFGRYAAAGAGMATLMSPTLSSANNYERGRLIFHSKNRSDGRLFVEGGYNNEGNTAGGYFRGAEYQPGKERGGVTENRIPSVKIGGWDGSWNIYNDGKFSGQGTLYRTKSLKDSIGSWSANGQGYVGRYTIIWNH